MTMLKVVLSVLIALSPAGSAGFQARKGSTPDYPVIISESEERRARAEREWKRMLDSYNAPPTPADLYPITSTPRSLSAAAGIMIVPAKAAASDSDTLTVREAMKVFLERWRELIGVAPDLMSLQQSVVSGDSLRLTFKQANYPFAVENGYGVLTAVLSLDGRLLQLDDRVIPLVDLPSQPKIDREAARARLKGRTFTYSDVGGHEQIFTVSGEQEIAVKRLAVVPIEKAGAMEVHLAWEMEAGQSLSWTVYVDAITGEELVVVQNFKT
jgi:hypothetical protein